MSIVGSSGALGARKKQFLRAVCFVAFLLVNVSNFSEFQQMNRPISLLAKANLDQFAKLIGRASAAQIFGALLLLMMTYSGACLADNLNLACRINGGDAECTGPDAGPWWCQASDAGNATGLPGRNCAIAPWGSPFRIRCATAGEAQIRADEVLYANGFCSIEKPPAPAPFDEMFQFRYGVKSQISHIFSLIGVRNRFDTPVACQSTATWPWNGTQTNDECDREITCPPGYADDSQSRCYRLKPEMCPAGNPIQCAGGEKTQTEVDVAQSGSSPEFVRHYSSSGFYASAGTASSRDVLGANWRHSWQSAVVVEPATVAGQVVLAYVVRPNGDYRHFTLMNGAWVGRKDKSETLEEILDQGQRIGWRYVGADDTADLFDATGRLLSSTTRAGLSTTLTYSDASTPANVAPKIGLLIRVTNWSGRYLDLRYDASAKLTSVIDTNGATHGYRYDTTEKLVFVDRPGTTTREYRYNQAGNISGSTGSWELLTDIFDENGNHFGNYQYDYFGRANKEWHGTGTADQLALTYTSNFLTQTGSTRLLDAAGQTTQRKFVAVNGILRDAGTDRCTTVDCSTIGQSNSKSYDGNGNPQLSTDFNGVTTHYEYLAVDATGHLRGLETKRIEAFGKPEERTIETDWHPTFRVASERRTRNASGALEAQTKWTYNTRGQATARCEIDPDPNITSGASTYICGLGTNAPAGVRQSITTYCEQADITAGTCPLIGLVKSVNGARLTTNTGMSGLDDLTTYTYYQTDDATCATNGACPHRHGDLWKVTNALGQVTENVSYDKNGRVTRMKDANGTYTDLVYHARGWLTDRIVRASATGTPGAGDATMHIDYDGVGNVTKVTQPDGAFLGYTYDDAHRLTKITDKLNNTIDYCPGGAGSADCLDAAGNRKVEQVKDSGGNIKRSLHRVYNQLSQLTKVLNAASVPVEHSDGLSATGVVDGYDGNGNRVLSLDGLGNKTEQDVDALNRLKASIQNVGGAGTTANTTTGYAYDTRDNLRQVTDPDLLNTVYDYDGLNNLTGLHSPDTGLSTYTPDAAGNRTSQTDNRGQVSNYTYDALNRLTAIAYVNATGLNVGYAYDQADATTGCSGSFPKGRLTTMTDASGSTAYCYDRRGNVTRKKQVAGSVTSTMSYTYTIADRLATITYPSGGVATYVRDALGRITAVNWGTVVGGKATALVSGATYYPFGPLNTLTFLGGRTLTKTYDQDYTIDSISGTPAGALTLDFGVDVMGNITNASSTLSPPTPNRTYAYDPLYRLTTAQTGTSSPLESYTYDKTGDRLSAALNGGVAQTYAYTPLTHRLASVAGTTRTYDLNGNTQTGTAAGLSLTYDARNRLSAMAQGKASASYGYNGRGERVNKQNNPALGQATNVTYAYGESGQLLGEYGSAQVEYIYLDSIPVAVIKAGVAYYIETDHLGTPQQVIDKTRNVAVWKWDSLGNTFGASAPNEDPDGDGTQFGLNLRFPGQYFDGETGLNYNYFRDYEAGTGRYVESDPIGLKGGIGTYAYVQGDPLGSIDLQGLDASGAWGRALGRGAAVDIAGGGPADPVGDACALVVIGITLADEFAKGANQAEVKRICDEPPPTNLNPCELARWKLTKALRCQLVRIRMTAKWFGGTYDVGHAQRMTELVNEIETLKRTIDRECKKCPSCN